MSRGKFFKGVHIRTTKEENERSLEGYDLLALAFQLLQFTPFSFVLFLSMMTQVRIKFNFPYFKLPCLNQFLSLPVLSLLQREVAMRLWDP